MLVPQISRFIVFELSMSEYGIKSITQYTLMVLVSIYTPTLHVFVKDEFSNEQEQDSKAGSRS